MGGKVTGGRRPQGQVADDAQNHQQEGNQAYAPPPANAPTSPSCHGTPPPAKGAGSPGCSARVFGIAGRLMPGAEPSPSAAGLLMRAGGSRGAQFEPPRSQNNQGRPPKRD